MANARRKKSYLLDPRFQLKWTAYLVAVVVVVMVGLGVVIAQTANRAADSAAIAVRQAEKAFEESRTSNTLLRRTMQLTAGDDPAMKAVMDESLGDVDAQSEKNLSEVRARREGIERDRKNIQLLLAGAGVTLVAVLLFMGIVITHRITGPVHKMKRLLRRVSTGRLVIEERLRRGDELADLFDTFLQMTYSLRAMQQARLATLDDTIRQAEASATPPQVVDGMRALRAQLVLGLEPRRPSLFSIHPPTV